MKNSTTFLYKTICVGFVLLVVSCSPAKVAVTKPEPVAIIKEPTELEILNDKMLNSQSYVTFSKHGEDFLEKLNYSGTPALLADEAKMLAWIKDNIKASAFTSYDEAVVEWKSMVNDYKNVMIENAAFFELYKKAAPDEVEYLPAD